MLARKRQWQWLWVAISALLITACGDSREQVHLSGSTMGTTYNIKYIASEGIPSPEDLQKEIDKRLEKVNDQMSTYRKNSELSLFNQYKGREPYQVSADMVTVVKEAIRLNRLTLGALDVTVGPLVNLWGFGPETRLEEMPTDAEVNERRAEVGIQHLTVTEQGLKKDIPDLYVDLSTIAKGWGVDVVANYLSSQNINNYLVEIGGEVRAKGKNKENVAWRIAIEKPDANERAVQEIIEIGDMSMATSGDYRNYFEENGVRYSHIIDPKTGRPINNKVVSVSAIDSSCMTADGLATGFMVLGDKKGIEIANQYNIPIFMVVKTSDGYKEVYSDAFAPYLHRKNNQTK